MLLAEKETIITFDETGEPASVFTYNRALQRKLDKLCAECPESVRNTDKRRDGSKSYTVPKNFVCLRHPPKYTDEQRANMVESARRNLHK